MFGLNFFTKIAVKATDLFKKKQAKAVPYYIHKKNSNALKRPTYTPDKPIVDNTSAGNDVNPGLFNIINSAIIGDDGSAVYDAPYCANDNSVNDFGGGQFDGGGSGGDWGSSDTGSSSGYDSGSSSSDSSSSSSFD